MEKHNGTELQSMTYNGQEVGTWIHNGVEVYSASKPWEAISCDGTTLTANSPTTTPTGVGGSPLSVPSQWMWQIGGSGNLSIESKNVDGTSFIPTNKCKYMDVIVRADGSHNTYCEVTGKKSDGSETIIFTQTIPKYNDNTKNVVNGVTLDNKYPCNLTNIDVKGYVSVKVRNYCNVSGAGHSVGLGRMVFHN